jgi:hypothetical protein
MRLFYFLPLLLIPSLSFGQACTEATLAVPAASYSCTTLTISAAGLNRAGDNSTDAIQVTVTNDVIINGDIILDGQDGVTVNGDNVAGGLAGPGGLFGGGISITSTEDGAFPPEGGAQGAVDASCSSGGAGGASYLTNGANGGFCSGGIVDSTGGITPNVFPNAPFAGGFGGGAGGKWNLGGGVYNLGSGGGGGGGLMIDAGGTITIANGVTISTRGGRGGNSLGIGGGGGGGGGGNIYLLSNVAIVNQGILDVRGGQGGTTRAAVPFGGVGGNGGDGRIRLDLNGAVTDLTGRQDFSTAIPTSSTSSLKSDISCGSVAKKNDDSMLFQMIVGFMLVVAMRHRRRCLGALKFFA